MLLHHLHRGEGLPVILLHGLFGSAANLGMVARGLAADYSVYSLDLPNHGRSPRTANMSYTDMADAVARFIARQELGSCYVLGHSMGGKVAMQLALDYQDLVGKLVVADIAPVQYPAHHDQVLAGLRAVEEAAPADRKGADAVLSEHVLDVGVRAFLLKSWQKDARGHWHWLINIDSVTANYGRLGEPNRPGRHSHSFNGDTLFIAGAASDYLQPEHRDDILDLFPRAQVKIIEGTGHWLHAEKPQIFNRLVSRFLAAER